MNRSSLRKIHLANIYLSPFISDNLVLIKPMKALTSCLSSLSKEVNTSYTLSFQNPVLEKGTRLARTLVGIFLPWLGETLWFSWNMEGTYIFQECKIGLVPFYPEAHVRVDFVQRPPKESHQLPLLCARPQKCVCTWDTICEGLAGEAEGSVCLAELASCSSSRRLMYSSRKAKSSI